MSRSESLSKKSSLSDEPNYQLLDKCLELEDVKFCITKKPENSSTFKCSICESNVYAAVNLQRVRELLCSVSHQKAFEKKGKAFVLAH